MNSFKYNSWVPLRYLRVFSTYLEAFQLRDFKTEELRGVRLGKDEVNTQDTKLKVKVKKLAGGLGNAKKCTKVE